MRAKWIERGHYYYSHVELQNDGTTGLWMASQNGHDAVVKALLASGAKVNEGSTVSTCGVVGVVNMDVCVIWSV